MILNDEDEEEENQDKFNTNGFLSIGSDYFSSNVGTTFNELQEGNTEQHDLQYHNTFASLPPIEQTHYSTSHRTKVMTEIPQIVLTNLIKTFVVYTLEHVTFLFSNSTDFVCWKSPNKYNKYSK